MSTGQVVAVTPSVLAWAREEGGYAVDEIAHRLHVKDERVVAWEQGARQPTLRQTETLAKVLHRPLGLFFLPRPPQLPPLAAEYRRLPGVTPGRESPALRLALRQMLTRRENALNLLDELGEPTPDFLLRAHLREPAAAVGQRLRQATGIDVDTQLGWPDGWGAWNAWRAAIERVGALVFQFAKVALEEARGLTLPRTPLPVAAINGKELPEAKTYTLFHEVVHLMLAEGHEEVPALRELRSAAEWTDVERFAEVAASHALVPEDALQRVIRELGLSNTTWDVERVRQVARKFRLTPLAIATRLRESRVLSWAQYNRWRAEWARYVATLPPRRGGFATPAGKALNRAGRPFVQLVLEGLSANRLTPVDAARYLDLKFEHFDALRARLSEGAGSAMFDE